MEKPIQRFQGFASFCFQLPTRYCILVPEIFHQGDEPPFFRIEVAVEFIDHQIVELFQDEVAGILLGERSTDGCQKGVSPGQTHLYGRMVLVQSGDFFLVRFIPGIKSSQLGLHLSDHLQAFGLELVTAQAFELKFEGQLVGFYFQGGLVLFDARFDVLDCLVLGLEIFQLLAGGFNHGGSDFLVLIGFVTRDLLGGFHGFDQFALDFADLSFEGFDGLGFRLEEGSDQVVVGNKEQAALCQISGRLPELDPVPFRVKEKEKTGAPGVFPDRRRF